MQIRTEQDMMEFCKQPKSPFSITLTSGVNLFYELEMIQKNKEMISQKKIGENSHLQQGILEIYASHDNVMHIIETPYLYPSKKILAENHELTGPMTGTLVNCYDPGEKMFLFHIRGTDIANPFGFQAAAAGMGVYGQHPSISAALELYQEAGSEKFRQFPKNGLAIDILPFMKAGKIPQILFSFGFLDNLSGIPICRNLEDIAEFESKIKTGLQTGKIEKREAYHFILPYEKVERITGELNDSNRFYGPVYDSTINFIRALKDNKCLD